MIGDKLGYNYHMDGNFLIRKTCVHCGEGYDVHAMSQTQPVDLCDACSFVANEERKAAGSEDTEGGNG